MANKLPIIGVIAEVQNADRYFAILENIERATASTAKALEKTATQTVKVSDAATKATKNINPLTKLLSKLDDQFGGVGKKAQSFAKEMGVGADQVAALSQSLGVSIPTLALAAAGAAAFAAAFLALGQRGAGLIGISESFDRLAQSAGIDAVAALQRLRVASGGTVADFELLRLTNLALAGATGEFGKQFGENLPRILEIARVQARATGQSVDFLFQSLITGIKRGSPLLIDNTGLVLKISAANETMAQSLGKTVEQLTAEEKQLAVLNATLAAGQTALDAFAGIQETSADKLARMNATITNTLDALAVGVQPAFGMFLDVINRVLSMIQTLVVAMNPLISSLLELGAAIITGPAEAFLTVLDPIVKFGSFLLTLGTAILQPVIRSFTAFFRGIGEGAQRISQLVGELFAFRGLNWDNLAINFGRGAGAIIAAFGNGMLAAYNEIVHPILLGIATAIADFLIGESPPPKGPLSKIDKGGAATMNAWMEGFSGVSLQPVAEVAAAVEATLGNVGRMALPQVEARLGLLDQALAPFNNQLEIIKANFEAISAPAQAALSAIERQTAKAEEALAAGDIGAAERIRALDTQREMIEKAVDAQQQLVDQAQIQQTLAKAQQAPERALLAIQQARLKALETKKTPEAKAAAEAAGKGGAPTPEMAAAGGAGMGFDSSLPSVSDLVSGQAAVDQIGQGFGEGLAVSINQGTLAAFQENRALLGEQVSRIQTADVGTRIANAFSGLGASISTKLQEASTVINDWIGSITDPAREGSIPFGFNALINGDWGALSSSLTAPFDTWYADASVRITDFLGLLTDPANEASIVAGINAFAAGMPEFMQPVITSFADNFGLISEGIQTWLDDTFNPDNVNSIPGTLALLPTRIENALRDVGTAFSDSVLVPIQNTITDVGLAVASFFVNTGEGTLSGYIDAGVAWFVALPQRIFDALASMGQVFFAAIVTPLIAGVNLAIAAIEGLINNALSGLGTLIGSLQGVADAVGMGGQLAEISAALVGGINLPRIAMPAAPAAAMPGAKRGGIFSGGMFRAGELGTEVIANAASKTAVFPASVTRDLDVLARVLGGGGSMAMPMLAGGGMGNSNSNTWNNEFNVTQPPSAGNFSQQVAMMQSSRGRRKF